MKQVGRQLAGSRLAGVTSTYRAARSRLTQTARSRLGRRFPETLGVRRFQSLLDDYQVADLIETDGKVPLNYFTYRPNFGDLLSPWLVRQMTGREVVVADRSKPHYVVIGSIISQGTDQSIFWGTGTYGTEGKAEVAKKARYTAVRGPLTQAKLSASKGFGVDTPQVYGDPALLLPLYYLPEVPITHEYGVIVRWSERKWAQATYGDGVKLIDFARDDVEDVVREMLSCRKIITSSLHGLIVADAYGIPNAWLASGSPRGGVFKFYDYFASVQKFRKPHKFDPTVEPVTVERLRASFDLSDEAIDFDYRALLDASPFLQRQGGSAASGRAPSQGSAAGVRSKPGVASLLPSLGYFGGIAANFLSVRVSSPITGIRLSLPDDEAEVLDLRGVELYRNRRRVVIDEGTVELTQSSEGFPPGRQRNPFAYGGIRTEKEPGAWWQVSFASPVDADEIRVYNRRDGWGSRSRRLAVAVAGSDGHFHPVASVDSDEVIETTLTLLRRLTGRELPFSVLDTAEAAAAARSEVLEDLVRLAGRGPLTADREEQRLLASLLRRHRLPKDQPLTDAEWTLLGHLLAAERARVPATGTSLQSFRMVLDSRAKLTRLETEVNQAGTVLGTPRAVLTRHGFTDVGALRKRSEDYLGVMERAAAVLRDCGHPAMLAYGTLLGAVREGNFLAHDDDIDMLIPTDAVDRVGVEKVLAELTEQLTERGWRVSRSNSYTNFHLTEPATKLHIDVFPMLVDGERTQLHMEKMRLREIPTQTVLPPHPITFLGREMLAPADPEAFLADRYGEGWKTPDPFYDWPWKLED